MTYAQLSQSLQPQIAVFRSLPGLGDFLCIVPALRALRAALPEAHLVYIGLPNAPEWVEGFSLYINEFVESSSI